MTIKEKFLKKNFPEREEKKKILFQGLKKLEGNREIYFIPELTVKDEDKIKT